MRRAAVCAFLAIAGFAAHGGQATRGALAAVTIVNERITATFDDRGLVSLVDRDAGPYRFHEDGWEVAIDGRRYDSHSLPLPARTNTATRVTYRWTAASVTIDVIYELAPGWHFLGKQILVHGRRQFHVDEVVAIKTALDDPITGSYVPGSARPSIGTIDYGVFLRFGPRGLLALAQNPFLEVTLERQTLTIRYKPDMNWHPEDGAFESDLAFLVPCRLTGRRLPARMAAEWARDAAAAAGGDGADEAEVEAFTETVRTFLTYRPERPLNLFVGWCANDYQIDVATTDGQAEYKRLIDRAAALGAEYVLYAPSNSAISRRDNSVDDWSWEHVLWLGLGQRLRRGDWDPVRDPVPPSVQQMLDYARAKHVKLLAYVYPVLPFNGDPSWLVADRTKSGRQRASLGVRAWQDRLVELLVAFHDRLGIGGYSFDHTFLRYDGTSGYAQWSGWRRVMTELRRRIPDIVVDGRQAYHLYGPWSWVAGSYPHPTFNDEQPESFVPFPDLHFDRVSADRERYTAYRYRNYEFAPSEIVPGFITHQTPRNDASGDMPQTRTADRGTVIAPFRQRDWDYLGWRYSLISSIAVAGWNNVIDMIPARDPDENRVFSADDRRWFRQWIDWTREHKELLRYTRTILGQPAIGKIDGTAAIVGARGFIFLFNPDARRLTATIPLGPEIGLDAEPAMPLRLKELYPLTGRLVGKPGTGDWARGDAVSLTMDGQSAMVLELAPDEDINRPALFGVPGEASIDRGRTVRVTGALGEPGRTVDVMVRLPEETTANNLFVNGARARFSQHGRVIQSAVRFDGVAFAHAQQVGTVDSRFVGGRWTGTITIPARIVSQLQARRRAWPIRWTAGDLATTWLAPERLVLFVQIAEPDDRWSARLTIDGSPAELRKAYSAIVPVPSTFVGFYADISKLDTDRPHRIDLDLPPLRSGQFQGVFIDNVEPEYTRRVAR